MSNITIYTKDTCPYCVSAKQLLDSKKAKYKEINVGNDPKQREELVKKANGQMTVPQIFIGDKHIGGYDNLSELNNQGKLDEMLKS